MRLYVYYRVPEPRLGEAVAAVTGLQATLQGVDCGLLRRPGTKDGFVTLMETYAGAVPDDLEARAAQALQGLLEGERHVEVFVPLA